MAYPMRHNSTRQDIVTQATFTRMCGLAAQSTVMRAVRRGKVKLTPSGRVNINDPTNKAYMRESLASCAIRAAPAIMMIKEKLKSQEDF